MTFVILNAEIDLSVASMMGLSACALGWLVQQGVPMPAAIVLCLLVGILGGAFNGFWITVVRLPSLVVTLAMLIGFRGLARVLVEDRSIKEFPAWFEALGQQPLLGPFPLSLLIFFALLVLAVVVLRYSGFGRQVYVIGISLEVARYSGIDVARVKMLLFTTSGFLSALAGVLFAARLGTVRGDMGLGFELDIITIVLLGGVSIFGGAGSVYGVILSSPHRALPPQRDVAQQHHRAPADRSHWHHPDPVGYDSERAELSRPRDAPRAPALNSPGLPLPSPGRRDQFAVESTKRFARNPDSWRIP